MNNGENSGAYSENNAESTAVDPEIMEAAKEGAKNSPDVATEAAKAQQAELTETPAKIAELQAQLSGEKNEVSEVFNNRPRVDNFKVDEILRSVKHEESLNAETDKIKLGVLAEIPTADGVAQINVESTADSLFTDLQEKAKEKGLDFDPATAKFAFDTNISVVDFRVNGYKETRLYCADSDPKAWGQAISGQKVAAAREADPNSTFSMAAVGAKRIY